MDNKIKNQKIGSKNNSFPSRGRWCEAPDEVCKKGISLISLIITIIVIIILAAIIIFSGFGTTESAGFAKFAQEFSSYQEELNERYQNGKLHNSMQGDIKLDSEIYAEIAGTSELQIVDMLDGKALSEDLDGTVCYKLSEDRTFYQGDSGTYITDKGEIFTLPGYRYSINGEERRYVTSDKYYTRIGIVTPGVDTGSDPINPSEEENPPTNVEVVGTIPNDSTAETWALLGRIAKSIAENSNIKNTSGECTVIAKDNDNNWKKYTLEVGQQFTVRYSGEEEPVRILGFNHDELANPNAYGAGVTVAKAGISFEFVNILESYHMNPSTETNSYGTNAGGWEVSEMRAYLNGENEGEGLNKLDNATKNVIKAVKKQSIKGSSGSWTLDANNPTIDKLWLLSVVEVFNSSITVNGTLQKEGIQYAFYVDKTSTDRIKKLNGTAAWWWLRSPICNFNNVFCGVYEDGDIGGGSSYYSEGVSVGFSI